MDNNKNSNTTTTTVSNLCIYGDYLSQPFRSIVSFCKLNKIQYEVKHINISLGEHLTEEFKKINPYGKIPSIVLKLENGKEFKLSESCAILRFLSEYYKVDEKWYPSKDSFRKALIDQWLDWHHLNSRYAFSNFFFRKVFQKKLEEKGIKRQTVDTEKMVEKVLHFLNKILKERKFIVDDEISIADLIISCEMNQLHLANYDFSKLEFVNNYLTRINSIKEIKEINKILENIAIKIKINLSSPKF